MFTLNNLDTIEQIEATNKDPHIIVLLFVKPSDSLAKELIEQLNYYHFLSKDHCSVYCAGFMTAQNAHLYKDSKKVQEIDGEAWYYSDACFVEVTTALEKRLDWQYVGEPQLIILQRSLNEHSKSKLDFSNRVPLDLADGIRKGYIENIPRFLNALLKASTKEVTAFSAFEATKKKLSIRDLMITTLKDSGKTPTVIKDILSDYLFYNTSKHKQS